jgi:hypothetical protein
MTGIGDSFVTIKYDVNGAQQWIATCLGVPRSLTLDDEGNIYVTGLGSGSSVSSADYATIKYSPTGQQQWLARYNGPINNQDEAWDIAVDQYGNVCVTGKSTGSNSDYATIKYSQPAIPNWVQVEAVPFGAPLPQECRLEPPAPNPFNLSTDIRYQMPDARNVNLRVYDTAGRLVNTLVNGWREAGTHEVTFEGSALASGMYFVQMQAGEYAGVQKMMLLK